MIVPRTSLLVWSALVLVPFGTIAGIDTAARPVAWILIALFVALVVVDAVLSPARVQGLSFELPEITRASQDRDFTVALRIHNVGARARSTRVALQAPHGLGSINDEMSVALPPDSEWSQVNWAFRPFQRGRFVISAGRVEAVSPLGFWSAWKTVPAAAEFRIYPNLMRERRQLAALFLNRGGVGLHAQRMIGKGRDFEKLREYVAGDSFDEIHWKATAKRGQPVTKVYQIERTQEIYVIIDSSRLSARSVVASEDSPAGAPTTNAVIERFITSALMLGLAAENQGDLFGLLTFSDKIETFLRARNGKAHYHACRDALYTLQARDVTPDFDELSTFIRLRLRRRALLLFLTSVDDPVLAESFVRNMDLICRQHLIVVNMLRPAGVQPLFSAPAQTEHEIYEQLGGHMRWHALRELEKVLHRRGVRFALLENERLAADMVAQYLNVKQRQLL